MKLAECMWVVWATMLGCGSSTQSPARPSQPSLRPTIEAELVPGRVITGVPSHGQTLVEARRELGDPGVVIAAWGPGGITIDETWGAPPHAVFQGMSMSKPVACLGAYVLVDRGVLSLDEDVNAKLARWKLPPAPSGKPVTLRQLCTQKSGLAQVSPDLSVGYARGAALPTIVQTLAGEAPSHTAPLKFDVAPGEREQWSGENWLVLQLLVEDATHRGFADVMKDVVLDPLELHDSSFAQPAGPTLMPGHEPDGTPIAGGSHIHPELAGAGLTLSGRDSVRIVIELERIAHGGSKLLSPALQRELGAAIRAGQLGLFPDAQPGFLQNGTHAYGYLGLATAALDRDEGVVAVAGCHEEQEGCLQLVLALTRTVVRAAHLPWEWEPMAPRRLAIQPVDLAPFAGTWRYPAIDVDGHALPETTCTATQKDANLIWSCASLPERTMYSLGAGRFASLVEAPDIAFDGDRVRLLEGDQVLREGVRVR